MLKRYGGKLAPADRLARGVAGLGLIAWVVVGSGSLWVQVLAAGIGVSLLVEAALNYCPMARIWPWNRSEKG